MTREEAARIAQHATFRGSMGLDAVIATMEARLIHFDGYSPDDARAEAGARHAAILAAQAGTLVN